MACSDYDEPWEAIANLTQAGGQAAIDAVNCPYDQQVGMAIYATVVFSVIGLGIVAHNGSRMGKVSMLLVLGIIAAPVYMSLIPAVAVNIVVFVVVITMAVAFYVLFLRRRSF